MSDDPTEIKPVWPAYNPYEPGNPYYGDTSIPPPPPSYRKRRRILLVVSVIVAILLIFAGVGSFLFMKLNAGITTHSSTSTRNTSPTSSPTSHLTAAPSANGQSDLYSQNFTAFYGAFTQAMSRYCWRIRPSKGRSIFLKHQRWLIFPTEQRKKTFVVVSFPTF